MAARHSGRRCPMDRPSLPSCCWKKERISITRVSVGGENAWYMMGHVFWSEPFSRKFVEILEREYDTPEIRDKQIGRAHV